MRRNCLLVGAALLGAGSLMLAGCGSDAGSGGTSNSPSGQSSASSSNSTTVNTTSATCVSGSLKSDGSTAQQNAMNQWISNYQQQCSGASITYGGGGSGQGITDFSNKQVDFAGSDAALDPSKGEVVKASQACGSQAIDLPMVTGPIAVAYHVKGVKTLTLTAEQIAKIFTGKITKWNDPSLAASNKGVTLPAEKITVFNRSDASGTTQNFERYLAASAPSVWTAKPAKQWSGAGQGKKGNQLVGQAVQSTEGAIGYVEWSYAIQNNLDEARIDNGGGAVALTADTVAKTIATATVAPSGPGDLTLKLDYATKAPGAYPIVLVTYEIVCTKYSNPQIGSLVKSFLTFVSSSQQQAAVHNLGYAALPASVQAKVQAEIAKIS